MKKLTVLVLVAVLALGLMAFASAQSSPCSGLVLGGACTLDDGDKIQSDMVILGGSAVLKDGSAVKGDVVVLGGTLNANGLIEGDLNIVGGAAQLGDNAVVEGDVNTAGGSFEKSDSARIEGSYNANVPAPFVLPGRLQIPSWYTGSFPQTGGFDPVTAGVNIWLKILGWLFRSFMWAVVALVVVLLIPSNTERVSRAATTRPVESGGLGCLTAIIVPIVLVVLAITICGIPFSLIGAVLLTIAWGLGLIALGWELGRRLTAMLKVDWAPAVTAAVGTGLLTLVTNGVGMIPCIGWVFPLLVGALGLGAVLLTRFGSQNPEGPVAGTPRVTVYTPPAAPSSNPADVYTVSDSDEPVI